MDIINMKLPDNTVKPAAGKLLIAEPLLNDPNFSRTVILICEHNDEGTIGFILNHATTVTLGDVLPELDNINLPLYQGGPVSLDTLHMLHRMENVFHGKEIAKGIFWGGTFDSLEGVATQNDFNANDIRLFVGYSGWSPGQLENELETGSWIVTEVTPTILFDTAPRDIWKAAIATLGREYNYLVNMPINPQLN